MDAEGPQGFTHERYIDLGVIGAGGDGEVRRVFDPVLNRTIAMKLLHGVAHEGAAVERFHAEARLCARLAHPAIIAITTGGCSMTGGHSS